MGNASENGVQGKEIPLRHNMCRRDQKVGFDIIVAVAQKVWQSKNDKTESKKNKNKAEEILEHVVGAKRGSILGIRNP